MSLLVNLFMHVIFVVASVCLWCFFFVSNPEVLP